MNIKKLSDTFGKIAIGALGTTVGAVGLGLMSSSTGLLMHVAGAPHNVSFMFAKAGLGIAAVGLGAMGVAGVSGTASVALPALAND